VTHVFDDENGLIWREADAAPCGSGRYGALSGERRAGERSRKTKKWRRNGCEGAGRKEDDTQRWSKAEIHACHGTEQTRASRAYDGAGAHLRLEDKHRHLYKLVDTSGKKYRV